MNVNQALIMLRLRHVPDTKEELRKAYKEATARWHPDKAKVNGISEQVASYNMSRVNQANTLLMGVIRLRSESRLGKYYSDPIFGQHFLRDESGYIASPSSIYEIYLFIRGVMTRNNARQENKSKESNKRKRDTKRFHEKRATVIVEEGVKPISSRRPSELVRD